MNAKIKFDKELNRKIEEFKKQDIFHALINITGDSMTCKDVKKSIPDGSFVYVSELDVSGKFGDYDIFDIPIDRPLVFEIKSHEGSEYLIKHAINTFQNLAGDRSFDYVTLGSYNNKYKPAKVLLSHIVRVLDVHKVFSPKNVVLD